MALADLAAYLARSQAPNQAIRFSKASLTMVQGRMYDLWLTAPDAGVAPTTAVVPTRATAGSLGQQNPAADLQLIGSTIAASQWVVPVLIDRLSHQGGLSGIVIIAQTTNLPTAALTRYTAGNGVMIGLSIYAAIGATLTTVSASYTNEAGTAGRTTPLTDFGGTGFNAAQRFITLPLQQGDDGVRSVQSVTVTATTGTAGNFGVVLYRPLVALPVPVISQSFDWDALLNLGAVAPDIVDNACLSWLAMSAGTSSGIIQGEIRFAED